MMLTEHTNGLYSIQTNLNIPKLKQTCFDMYSVIKANFDQSEDNYTGHTSLHKGIFQKYNFLMYTLPEIHETFTAIKNAFFLSAEKFYGQRIPTEPYYVQSWMNFYFKGDFIDWHHHDWNMNRPMYFDQAWHGFICVDTEPDSKTSYRWKNHPKIIDIPSKDGLLVIGISNGDVHKSSEWLEETRPRITIAFDIVPRRNIFYSEKLLSKPFVFEEQSKELVHKLVTEPEKFKPFINHWIPI